MYYVLVDEQRVEVPAEVGNDDKSLRQALSTFLPDLVNAKIERKVVEETGDVEITVKRVPGTKG